MGLSLGPFFEEDFMTEVIKGVAYYPEHWDKKLWEKDFDEMKALGVNTIRIGEFMWSLLEPKEGEYTFDVLDEIVEEITSHGFKIMLGIPTATFPIWVVHNYDHVLAKDIHGKVRKYGTRRQYCYNSKAYRSLSKKITEKIVDRYKGYENIIAWQIDNELGHEGSDFCTCYNCQKAFQEYLKDKYDSIDAFNEVCGNVFWGQIYNEFAQVNIPFGDLLDHNPCIRLEYARFMSKSIEDYNQLIFDVLDKYKSSDQQITTNLPGGLFNKWFNPNALAKPLDFISFDNYPVWGGEMTPPDPARVTMELDMIRGLKQDNFWIVEELIGGQGHDLVGWLPRPNQAKLWAMQANLKGAEHMFFFRFRQFNKGEEQFCQGIFDVDNERNYKFEEVQKYFMELEQGFSIQNYTRKTNVALLYDYDNIWSWKVQSQAPNFNFAKEALKLYRPVYDLGLNCDVIDTSKPFEDYEILIIPNMQIIDEGLLNRLKSFAKAGKTILMSYRAGIRNQNNNLYFGKKPIEALTGVKVIGYEALSDEMNYTISKDDELHEISIWRDILEPTTADGLYFYTDQGFENKPCITVNEYNGAEIYYIGSSVDSNILNDIFIGICEKNNIKYYVKDKMIEIVELENTDEKCKFVLNHNPNTETFDNNHMEAYEYRKLV